MSLLTLLLVALGVSADAFAVALGKGLQMRRLDLPAAVRLAVTFGLFQAGMPLVGYLLGSGLEQYITEVDHWIVFALLGLAGSKMIYEALAGDDGVARPADVDGEARTPSSGGTAVAVLPHRELLVLGVATSLDALAVGIGFAFLDIDIAVAVSLIGVCTALLSFVGVVLGVHAGARWRTPAEVAGGLVLLGIGTRILLDHLGVL
jgi:putative Mn2+ efflux pump MntP